MEKQQEEKQNDVILIGAKKIETHLRRTYLELVDLKIAYAFPLRNTDGEPSLNLSELDEWVKEWGNGLPFEKITTGVLQRRQDRLNILAMPSKPLASINEIAEFTGCELHEIVNWINLGINCPIKKDGIDGYSVDGKELRLWMFDQGIRAGYRENHGLNAY